MSNVTIRGGVYDEIKSKLHELKKKFDSNIKIIRDNYFGHIITIQKGCISSNSPLLALRCNCCKNVIDFAREFNEKFYFLLDYDPPLDFEKLDNHDLNNRRFKVEIKRDFFKPCGFMPSSSNQQGGFWGNQLNTPDNDNPNSCNITEEYPYIIKTFYKILGIPCPAFVTDSTDSVVSMFKTQDEYSADIYNGGLRIIRKTRRKTKSKKYKKMRKNKRSKKHHRRTKRRTRRK
jgi:hypothetical protein